jgi:hypothetical protein
MPISLNGSFAGAAPADPEFEHPAGLPIARLLREAARTQGWEAGQPDSWRDTGWFFACGHGAARLEVVITASGQDQWMLQVAPASVPGVLGRLLGSQPSAAPLDVRALSTLIHRALADAANYRGFRWQWDGPPSPESDDEPRAQA